jgi:hypothetical protein
MPPRSARQHDRGRAKGAHGIHPSASRRSSQGPAFQAQRRELRGAEDPLRQDNGAADGGYNLRQRANPALKAWISGKGCPYGSAAPWKRLRRLRRISFRGFSPSCRGQLRTVRPFGSPASRNLDPPSGPRRQSVGHFPPWRHNRPLRRGPLAHPTPFILNRFPDLPFDPNWAIVKEAPGGYI